MTKHVVLSLLVVVAAPVAGAGPIKQNPKPVPNSYIVVLNPDLVRADDDEYSRLPGVSEVTGEMLGRYAARWITNRGRPENKKKPDHVYQHALRGFAVHMTRPEAEALAEDYRVLYVEEDGQVGIVATESGATWGLDRIDQRDLPLNSTYTYEQMGTTVHVYVLDTGIRATHVEFAGRVGTGYTAIADGNGTNDCHGHGTHVSGTIGGTTYGVAKNVTLHPVRVLDCGGSGTTSGVVAGIDWVTTNHVSPSVANMSLGGGVSTALDDAVASSVAAGVTYAVAAGNSSADACNYSPARAPDALTVGATMNTDARASFSNYGACVDLFAPGYSITSAYYTSDTAAAVMSGTSMASPHVAGAAALYLETDPTATPAEVAYAITTLATPNHVTDPGTGSPNLLLYSRFAGGMPADTIAPVTLITAPTTGSTVNGVVTVQASATDASGVTDVDYYVDGSLQGSDTASPYAWGWDTTKVANGAHILVSRAYDPSRNIGTSAAVTVTVNNVAAPAEALVNGGFEATSAPWAYSGAATWTNGSSAHTGSGYSLLGGRTRVSGTVSQSVIVPAAGATTLSFSLSVASGETSSPPVDVLYVEAIVDGILSPPLATFTNLNKGTLGQYQSCNVPLAVAAGHSVTVRFRATNDKRRATTFLLDDVSFK
jgi:subtilisin family serine protease